MAVDRLRGGQTLQYNRIHHIYPGALMLHNHKVQVYDHLLRRAYWAFAIRQHSRHHCTRSSLKMPFNHL